MNVRVGLYNELKGYAPGGAGTFTQDLPPGARLEDLLHTLGIPLHLERVSLVNGRRAADDTPLRDGDDVVLFPPLSGG